MTDRLPKFGEVWAWNESPRMAITSPKGPGDSFKVVSLLDEDRTTVEGVWTNTWYDGPQAWGRWKLLSTGDDT